MDHLASSSFDSSSRIFWLSFLLDDSSLTSTVENFFFFVTDAPARVS